MGANPTTLNSSRRARLSEATAQLIGKGQQPRDLYKRSSSASTAQQLQQQLPEQLLLQLQQVRLTICSEAEIADTLAGQLPLLLQFDQGEKSPIQVWVRKGLQGSSSDPPEEEAATQLRPALQLVCLDPFQVSRLRIILSRVGAAASAEAAALASKLKCPHSLDQMDDLPVLRNCASSNCSSRPQVYAEANSTGELMLRVCAPPSPWKLACLWRQDFYTAFCRLLQQQDQQERDAAIVKIAGELPLRFWQIEWLRLQRLFGSALQELLTMLKQQQKQQGEEVGDCPYVRLASNLTAASAAAPTTLAATTARDAAEEALQMCCCN
ncbi:hypothetical protein ETH_00006465, partial [Eimeria tenella]